MTTVTYTAKVGLKHTGNEIGSWLASTISGSIAANQFVVNGGFDTDTVWVKGVDWSISSGAANKAQAILAGSSIDQGSILTPNDRIVLDFTVLNRTDGSVTAYIGGTDSTGLISTNGNFSFSSFVGTGADLSFFGSNLFNGSLDDVSVRLSDADLSSNQKDLIYFGTLTRSPVKPGSEVMSYSGFSSSNYLSQVDISLINSLSVLTVSVWLKATSNWSGSIRQTVCGNLIDSSSGGFLFSSNPVGLDQELTFYLNALSGSFSVSENVPKNVGEWNLYIVTLDANGNLSLYKDGLLVSLTAGASITSGVNEFAVGRTVQGSSQAQPLDKGECALLRVLNGALTNTEIKEIYESEKNLFKNDSVFTQVGENYSLEFSARAINQGDEVTSNKIMSISGNQETIFQRRDEIHDININQLSLSDLPRIRSFMRSVEAGETFIYDAYGSLSAPVNSINVVAEPGIKEQRQGTENNFIVPLKMRAV